jgi:hypothetical protein
VKSLRRILLNTATAVSLSFRIAAVADWVHGYCAYWTFERERTNGTTTVTSGAGAVYTVWDNVPSPSPLPVALELRLLRTTGVVSGDRGGVRSTRPKVEARSLSLKRFSRGS